MERLIIERLAMDVALGELNEDAAALLDAYLAEHPEARPWAQQMRTVCTRTQEAIDMKTQRSDASICGPSVFARRRASIHWAGALRWAAVVMVSLLIGVGIGRRPQPLATTPTATVAVETARSEGPKSLQEILIDPGKGFWEAKAAALWQSKPHRSDAPQPGLWETIRQLQRGYNNEQSRQ